MRALLPKGRERRKKKKNERKGNRCVVCAENEGRGAFTPIHMGWVPPY